MIHHLLIHYFMFHYLLNDGSSTTDRVGARRNSFRPSHTTAHTVPYTAVQFVAIKWAFP